MLDSGSGFRSGIMGGIDYVTARGLRPAVLSMTLGGPGRDELYETTLNEAMLMGVVVVVAAGNENTDSCSVSPAFSSAVITVGATTSRNERAEYSNYGACNDIMAPGSAILSATPASDNSSMKLDGTSMACPHVLLARVRPPPPGARSKGRQRL